MDAGLGCSGRHRAQAPGAAAEGQRAPPTASQEEAAAATAGARTHTGARHGRAASSCAPFLSTGALRVSSHSCTCRQYIRRQEQVREGQEAAATEQRGGDCALMGRGGSRVGVAGRSDGHVHVQIPWGGVSCGVDPLRHVRALAAGSRYWGEGSSAGEVCLPSLRSACSRPSAYPL